MRGGASQGRGGPGEPADGRRGGGGRAGAAVFPGAEGGSAEDRRGRDSRGGGWGWGGSEPVWLGPGESGAGPRRGRGWPSRERAAGASVCASVRGRARAREEAPE